MNVTAPASATAAAALCCRMCQFADPEVRLSCGCSLHAKCVPVQLIVAPPGAQGQLLPRPPNSVLCPLCLTTPVAGIELNPMTLHLLDQAVLSRKKQVQKTSAENDAFAEVQAETSYLLLSHPSSNSSATARSELQRTGRWTDEETEFVDYLVQAFDHGCLPMPVGVRLNDFLCSMLLCKASRLTKKMKNARLSVRSYEVNSSGNRALDCALLSTLQDKFLESIQTEATRYELRFNLEKAWRTHLSNLCVQVGYQQLDATAWIGSLEDMERRATEAEERLRQARRHRMGLALKTDVRAPTGVYFSGMPVQKPPKRSVPQLEAENGNSSGTLEPPQRVRAESSGECPSVTSSDASDTNHISNMLDLGERGIHHHHHGTVDTMDDFAGIFSDLIESTHSVGSSHSNGNDCGSFLERVVVYMEEQDLPFEHVDVWVPSYSPESQGRPDDLRLFHAGHATRGDLDPALHCQLVEYGEYSTKFSFRPNVGLPGRVYQSNQPSWECRIDEADPTVFERAGGAKVYGIKTGVGMPVASKFIGGLVVAMYSTSDLTVDSERLAKWTSDIQSFCPKPKWKLVVELDEDDQDEIAPGTGGFSRSLPKPSHASSTTSSLTRAQMMHSAPSEISLVSTTAKHAPEFSKEAERDEEIRIATLLGDYMPGAEIACPGEPTSSENAPSLLLPHFMSLRLLLLRSPDLRSPEDKNMLGVILKSYRGFTQDPSRSKKDVAHLLAKDWRFLRMTAESEVKKPAAAAPAPVMETQVYRSHVMNVPNVSTYAVSGVPVSMPSVLGGRGAESAATHHRQHATSFDSSNSRGMGSKKRRISSFEDGDDNMA